MSLWYKNTHDARANCMGYCHLYANFIWAIVSHIVSMQQNVTDQSGHFVLNIIFSQSDKKQHLRVQNTYQTLYLYMWSVTKYSVLLFVKWHLIQFRGALTYILPSLCYKLIRGANGIKHFHVCKSLENTLLMFNCIQSEKNLNDSVCMYIITIIYQVTKKQAHWGHCPGQDYPDDYFCTEKPSYLLGLGLGY